MFILLDEKMNQLKSLLRLISYFKDKIFHKDPLDYKCSRGTGFLSRAIFLSLVGIWGSDIKCFIGSYKQLKESQQKEKKTED
jgi:hypothetical protein